MLAGILEQPLCVLGLCELELAIKNYLAGDT
jgi:hypothetical protein